MASLSFHCTFCGEDFGEEIIELARHIGDEHDPVRSEIISLEK